MYEIVYMYLLIHLHQNRYHRFRTCLSFEPKKAAGKHKFYVLRLANTFFGIERTGALPGAGSSSCESNGVGVGDPMGPRGLHTTYLMNGWWF